MSETKRILRHLEEDYTEPVRDPLWKHIYLSTPLERLIHSLPFQKLHGIKQLGPAYLVYPGATHTRFSHSLGVFHLSRAMLTRLVQRRSIPGLTVRGVKAFLCAALLHDLGHFPFAHSLKDLNIEDHEALTARIILGSEALSRIIEQELAVPPRLVAAIVDTEIDAGAENGVSFFRNLLSGMLDPDKLDYLNRDAYFCGIPYGVQDIDFIFSQIDPHPSMGVTVTRKALASVESVLFSKYLMYKYAYWHKNVRIITAMIKKAILLALRAGKLSPDRLYNIDDREFLSLTREIDFPPFRIVERAFRRSLYTSVLSVPFSDDNPLHRRLEELDFRLEFERRIAREAEADGDRPVPEEEVIIDIPERISFEMDLPIRDGGDTVPYPMSGSVFSADVVQGFTRSLRTVTLLISGSADDIRGAQRHGLLDELRSPSHD